MQFNGYTQDGLNNYISMISSAHTAAEAPVVAYTHGATGDSTSAYLGGVDQAYFGGTADDQAYF